MNLLSHLYYSKEGLDNPLYTYGLIYPDLNRNWKKSRRLIEIISKDITRGIKEHVETDNIFHRFMFFKEIQEELMKEDTSNIGLRYFMFEFGTEIAIDYFVSKNINSYFYKRINDIFLSDEVNCFAKKNKTDEIILEKLIKYRVIESYRTIYGGREALYRTYCSVLKKYGKKNEAEAKEKIDSIYDKCFNKVQERWDDIYSKLLERLVSNRLKN